MTRDRRVHIHATPGAVCIACGDADTADTDFLTDPGQWNREARTCSPSKRVDPSYVLRPRADPRTSAVKDERMPNRRRVRDIR